MNPKKVHIIKLVLKKIKLSSEVIANSLLECNDKILNINLLELIFPILPTNDETI